MAEVLVVREYAMMRSSLFGYRDTVLRKTAVRRVEPGRILGSRRTANDGIFSLAIWIFWGYDDLGIHQKGFELKAGIPRRSSLFSAVASPFRP